MTNRMREPFHTLMWKASIGYNDSWSQVDPEVLEKFAEMIIRECTELRNHDDVLAPVGNSAWGEAYQDGWTEGTSTYRATILQHFGFDE